MKASDSVRPTDYNRVKNEGSYLKSSRVSWIMFWMKWICREVRGVSPPWPSAWTMFWDSEEETAAVDRAAPGEHTACLLGMKKEKKKWKEEKISAARQPLLLTGPAAEAGAAPGTGES